MKAYIIAEEMTNSIIFKKNDNLMALKTINSFGDQIIAVIDISKQNDTEKDTDFPFYAGHMIFKTRNQEGNWISFSEKSITKAMLGA